MSVCGGLINNAFAETKGKNVKEILDEMRLWHNGFRFTMKNESLYNPISIIEYLRFNGDVQGWSKAGGPSQFLVSRLKEFPQQALEIRKEEIITADEMDLTGKVNFESSASLTVLTALLFHNGYLSIKSYNNKTEIFTLKFSNLEVKKDYTWRLYNSFITHEKSDKLDH